MSGGRKWRGDVGGWIFNGTRKKIAPLFAFNGIHVETKIASLFHHTLDSSNDLVPPVETFL